MFVASDTITQRILEATFGYEIQNTKQGWLVMEESLFSADGYVRNGLGNAYAILVFQPPQNRGDKDLYIYIYI